VTAQGKTSPGKLKGARGRKERLTNSFFKKSLWIYKTRCNKPERPKRAQKRATSKSVALTLNRHVPFDFSFGIFPFFFNEPGMDVYTRKKLIFEHEQLTVWP